MATDLLADFEVRQKPLVAASSAVGQFGWHFSTMSGHIITPEIKQALKNLKTNNEALSNKAEKLSSTLSQGSGKA